MPVTLVQPNPTVAPSHPEHRERLYKEIGGDLAFLVGEVSLTRHNTDRDMPHRQESSFWWTTGVPEPDCMALLDGAKKECVVFFPRLGQEHALWLGKIEPLEDKLKAYGCGRVAYTDELPAYLEAYKGRRVHILDNLGPNMSAHRVIDDETAKRLELTFVDDLYAIFGEIRLCKTAWEVEQMRQSCQINADAFRRVMAEFRAPMIEYEAAGIHGYHLGRKGVARSFEAITAGGCHASILHNVRNDSPTTPGDVFLMDAGCEVRGYASDHTRVFPLALEFKKEQREIYEVVLAANKTCIELCKPGAKWEDVHMAGLRVLLEGLRKYGLVNPEGDFEEQMELGIPSIFQPHGLGHLLGLDTHDIGGYNATIVKSTDPRLKYLRTRRTLQPGIVITVEPGCYFIDGFLEEARNDPKKAKHLNFDVIKHYQEVCGGYRIEDNVVITEDGCAVFPAAPKEVEDIYILRAYAMNKFD